MNFELVKWKAEYLEDLFLAVKDEHLSDNLLDSFPCPMDTSFAVEFIKQRMLNSEQKQMCRAILVDGHAVGSVEVIIGSGCFEKSSYISIWIDKRFRRKGIGSEALRRICDMVFEKYQIVRIEAKPYSRDSFGIKALKNAGFVHEGTIRSSIFKNNQIFDCEMFSKIRK